MFSRLIFWPMILMLSLLFGVFLWYVPLLRVGGDIESPIEVEVVVTIPEGKNLKQISEILVKKHLASTLDEISRAQAQIIKEGKYRWLEGERSLEGYLFPDTYRFYRTPYAKYVLEKMLQNFEKKVMPIINNNVGKSDLKFKEILILASIIEKESTAKDRGEIADILIRRLKFGMPLQVDASVNYVTGLNKPGLSLDETKIDSPYNTYKFRGLPPGPISNPGVEAIKAVLNPKANAFWYYLSTKDGRIIYSRTLDEHHRNKAIYR